MSAQTSTLIGLPDFKVGLAGSPGLPVVINRSGRNLIGYVLLANDDTGVREVKLSIHIGRLAREPLESAHVLHFGEYGPIPAARMSLDSVIFSDGEFAGPDTAHLFDVFSMRVEATREFALKALDDISHIETMARSRLSRMRARTGFTNEEIQKVQAQDRAANELYGIQQSHGIEAARQAAERLSKLPKLWKGGK